LKFKKKFILIKNSKMNFFTTLISLFFIKGVLSQVSCPAKCPACTKCDPKKGTCILARDFVTCTKGTVPGVCFAGGCSTQLSLPLVKATNKCQTYSCPASGVCNLITSPDGSDCTPINVAYESICLKGVCQRIWLGLGETIPFQNVGCVGKPNGAVCDTNHVYTDGETCQNNVCKFSDGSYYGYVPTPPIVPV
jgi:hypothetical protein